MPAIGVLAVALSLRYALHVAARGALGVTRPSHWWLVPVRDLLGFAVWTNGITGKTVRWRNAILELDSR